MGQVFVLKYQPLGDSAVLVTLSENITPETADRVLALDQAVREAQIAGVEDCIPAYTSLLIKYDPSKITFENLTKKIQSIKVQLRDTHKTESRSVEIPVSYGGDQGPDLENLASLTGLTTADVIRLHSRAEYTVCFIGFLPGFPYLSGMDPRLAAPRLATPRQHVPAGSVGIAGNQTGIYPLDSPGGWQIIGQTLLTIFDPHREPPVLLKAGDRVKFIPMAGGEEINGA
jgi:KipI family sensor histidine kinase inhibitor